MTRQKNWARVIFYCHSKNYIRTWRIGTWEVLQVGWVVLSRVSLVALSSVQRVDRVVTVVTLGCWVEWKKSKRLPLPEPIVTHYKGLCWRKQGTVRRVQNWRSTNSLFTLFSMIMSAWQRQECQYCQNTNTNSLFTLFFMIRSARQRQDCQNKNTNSSFSMFTMIRSARQRQEEAARNARTNRMLISMVIFIFILFQWWYTFLGWYLFPCWYNYVHAYFNGYLYLYLTFIYILIF